MLGNYQYEYASVDRPLSWMASA